MTTYGPVNLIANVTADADFQIWCQGIHAALIAVGLVQTTDTGQLNLATAVRPAAATNAGAGYEMFRLSDALQATAPVFIRINYCCAASTDLPALFVSAATTTNGAGVLGNGASGKFVRATNPKNVGQLLPLVASGDGSRFSLSFSIEMFSANFWSLVSFERTRDATGANTADAGMVNTVYPGAGANTAQLFNPGVVTGSSYGPCVPVGLSLSKNIVGNDMAVGTMLYYFGKPFYGLSWVLIKDANSGGDLPGILCTFTAVVCGATHTYVIVAVSASAWCGLSSSSNDSLAIPCMLWE